MTRADFYVGRGIGAKWIGSIASDGYPGRHTGHILRSQSAREFRREVKLMAELRDFTCPENGWPWPWKSSAATDYAYAWDRGTVWLSEFGSGWAPREQALTKRLTWRAGFMFSEDRAAFPEMDTSRAAPIGTARSGTLLMGFGFG